MIKKLLGTMSVRIFLITVIGILLTATVVSMLGQRDSRENETRLRDQFAFDRIESMIRILEATVPEKRSEIQDVFKRMGSHVTVGVEPPQNAPLIPAELANLNNLLVPEIADLISLSKASHCAPRRPPLPPPGFGAPPPHPHGQCLAVYTHLEDNTPILIELHYGGRRPPAGPPHERNPLAIVLALLGLISIIWAVASVATQPLRKLANAALQLAHNIEHAPLPENEGSTEVRHAAKAFNEMQRSILKHIQERGFILGAIAHDLQTPLTRLRLRLEKVKDQDLKQGLIKDLTATQEMVREGLDFARLCGENIHKSKVDLTALATAVCDDFEDAGHAMNTSLPPESITILGSAHLLTRCLTNLLNNAVAYAQTPALSLHTEGKQVIFIISDDGPGIPPQELNNVLEPFRRLEDSRSRQTGGTGLGLAIARMIVEKHGGKLSINNKPRPASGLVINITLPLQ
ncbi:ATP-binding protein [Methylophilus sp.]|jgi:signal transduction histidine kinase|uniref:ATP-binding protein n=1 Tax=Methylophilus sp. TaxID=29541 RepID=UPI0011D9824A|nr:ATP-binding protein [Methylophilus sp.]TXI47021.1 MAG: HAMP domain-containing protein [Methylophilus sp.]